jgi:membrane protease YdiL (CAAX protease family)
VSKPPPYPGLLQALLLAVLGWLLAGLAAAAAADLVTPTAALGIGTVLGFGAAGALGATHVPPPHAERLGLRGLRLAQLPPLLLMVPLALLASEIDNTMRAFFPPPDAQQLAQQVLQRVTSHGDLALVESLVVVVGLVPVVEEWFFRGVLQQGLVARLGKGAGVFLCALLFAVGHGGPELSAASWAAVVAQILLLGLAFGWRHRPPRRGEPGGGARPGGGAPARDPRLQRGRRAHAARRAGAERGGGRGRRGMAPPGRAPPVREPAGSARRAPSALGARGGIGRPRAGSSPPGGVRVPRPQPRRPAPGLDTVASSV